MTPAGWADDDDDLVAEVKEALKGSGQEVPSRMLEAARAAFAWRTVDAELERLQLSSDSFRDDLTLVRGSAGPQPRLLVFEGNGIGVQVEVSSKTVIGQLYPTRSGLISVICASGEISGARTDEMGCFIDNRPKSSGPMRLRCDTEETSFLTDWFTT